MTPPELGEKSKKGIWIAIVGIGILVLLAGIFGYIYFQRTPEKIMAKMYEATKNIKTYEWNGEIQTTIFLGSLPMTESNNKTVSHLKVAFKGKVDIRDLNVPKAKIDLDLVLTPKGSNEILTFPLNLKGEMRIIDEATYLKFSNLPNLGLIDLSFLSDQWIKIETKEKEIPSKRAELNPEQIEKISEMIKNARAIKVVKKLPTEKIEGTDTYHYKFLVDTEALKKLVIEIITFLQNKELTKQETAKIEEALSINAEGEIWIGKKDYLPYKVVLKIQPKESQKIEIPREMTFTISFKNYNKPVEEIEIPSPVKTLEEVMTEIMSRLFGKFFEKMQLPQFQPQYQQK